MAVAIALLFNNCASSKSEPLYFEDGIVNLAGPWGENTQKPAPDTLTTVSSEHDQKTIPAEKVVLLEPEYPSETLYSSSCRSFNK